MVDKTLSPRENILSLLSEKAVMKSKIFEQSIEVFNLLKDVLSEMSNDLNEMLDDKDYKRVRLEYRDRGKFEAELKFADDVLIFSMHTDVFQFDREHPVWKNEYLKKEPYNSYCGVINVYNFLSDSMKFNRLDDMGYLVARLFVNKDKSFFVEGKRQKRQMTDSFGSSSLTREDLVEFVESAILYTLSFDLLVPPYDIVKHATVEQINVKIESSKMTTGKRLGYKYNSDDVLNTENND
ncbi:MAG: hypothetical protein IIY14_02895 [Bacteroidales bacterium]|jgi:hypothetical protein|nr:hypothetical protein [Bacteroidales bacterium]MBO7255974.1 hypothetical protein [Bacteroidales bacterium]MBO7283714.1 hypothetical protein [Bacteroidales bacterium]MBO7323485.1 hypothetical protein [Bacteroidales bacterium]MBQ1280050.1 hypothetical protein [Bacteroidales bacterium]